MPEDRYYPYMRGQNDYAAMTRRNEDVHLFTHAQEQKASKKSGPRDNRPTMIQFDPKLPP